MWHLEKKRIHMNKRTQYLMFFAIIALLILLPDLSFAQCAMCKRNAETGMQNGNSIIRGLNTGILYLMAIPYLALAFIFREQIKALYKSLLAKKFGK